MIRLFATASGLLLQRDGNYFAPTRPATLDAVFQAADPGALVRTLLVDAKAVAAPSVLHAPLQSQEVWAAGVTYLRSRTARQVATRLTGGVPENVVNGVK